MRLVYVAHARLPTQRAHGIQIARMCEAFAQAGAEVVLLKPRRRQPEAAWEGKDLREHYGLRTPIEVEDLPVLDLPIAYPRRESGLLAALWRLAETTTFLASLAAWVLRRRGLLSGAVVYTRDAEALLLLCALKGLAGFRLAFESHGRHRRLGGLLARSRADLWVALTRGLGGHWSGLGVPADRIIVEPDAVDPEAFADLPPPEEARRALGIPPAGRVVGYIGRFHMMGDGKGLDALIQAFGMLASERADLHLLLVGGPLERVEAALRSLPKTARERVRLRDYVPPSEVPPCLAALDAGVVPNPATEHYSLCVSPLKLFEYWAAGRPVVATDLPSLRELLSDGENAVLVRPGDADSMARGLARVLDDPGLGRRLARRGLEEARLFTWRARAGRILERLGRA